MASDFNPCHPPELDSNYPKTTLSAILDLRFLRYELVMSDSEVAPFLSAIEQLNQRYPPPTQCPVREYAFPQVSTSSTATESPPNFSLRNVASSNPPADIQRLEVSSSTPKDGKLQPPQYYSSLSRQFFERMMARWNPRPLSTAEIEFELSETRRLVANMEDCDRIIQRLGRHSDQGRTALHQGQLYHITYRTYFGRTFRINDLPLEILATIFRLVVDPATHTNDDVRKRNAITSVCRQWRSVALNDGTLWGVLCFSRPAVYEQCFEYFERAKGFPLTVIIMDTPEKPLTIETTMTLIERLFTKLSSIRALQVSVQQLDSAECFIRSLSRVGEQRIPMILERLEIIRQPGAVGNITVTASDPNLDDQPTVLFGGAYLPSLRHLAIGALRVNWESSVLRDLEIIDLRRLFLGNSPAVFRAMLQKCSNLSKMSLAGAGPRTSRPNDGPPIALPRLDTLAIASCTGAYTVSILSQFTAPNVVELNLGRIGLFEPRHFEQMIGKFPAVKSLTLNCIPLADGTARCPSIARWLRTMPLLVYLRIVNITQHILCPFLYDAKTLEVRPKNAPMDIERSICPKLKYIEIHYWGSMKMPNTVDIPHWFLHRSSLGLPLWKCFIGIDTLNTLESDRLNHLKGALEKARTPLYNHPLSIRPIEEQRLLGRG